MLLPPYGAGRAKPSASAMIHLPGGYGHGNIWSHGRGLYHLDGSGYSSGDGCVYGYSENGAGYAYYGVGYNVVYRHYPYNLLLKSCWSSDDTTT